MFESSSTPESSEAEVAFGQPGIPPTWQTARKQGVGTAFDRRSRVWFTLARGIVTEVYYPQLDTANLRDLQFLISDGRTFFHEEQHDLDHEVEVLEPGVPAYQIESRDPQGRYRLEKRIVTHPKKNALVMQIHYRPLLVDAGKYFLYLLANPQLGNSGWDNEAQVLATGEGPALVAWREGVALAIVTSTPMRKTSVGFVGTSDGWQDINRDLQMDWAFTRAGSGNVALTAQLEPGDSSFRIVLGFGRNPDEAIATASNVLAEPFREIEEAYMADWCSYLGDLDLEPLVKASGDRGRLLYQSAMLLASHEDKAHPGAHIASLSIPWGEQMTAVEAGGYHLVWPRDLYHAATSRLALGDVGAALRTLKYLEAHQDPDGSWPQNFWVDGWPYWEGLQLDEVAFPVLLAERLHQAEALNGFDPWPMVEKAALCIARCGPVTPQERWEENAGYSPNTLAVVISALVIAAEFARERKEEQLERYYLETADTWVTHLEAWTFTHCGALLPGHPEYYERIASLRSKDIRRGGIECRVFLPVRNQGDFAQVSQCCMVDPSFLDLVRYGVRTAEYPQIVSTLEVVDALLEVQTPCGPAWHRYNGDGYGEHADGGPFDGTGIGRAWPLLTGERAHYALARGDREQAMHLRTALECFANEGKLLPEQIWDAVDLPEKGLALGGGTGAATPLLWAHAEYVKVLRSLADGRVFDLVEPVFRRYQEYKARSDLIIWKFNHQVHAIHAAKRLRIEVHAPAALHWSADNWITVSHDDMREIVPGVWAYEFPPLFLTRARPLHFTFHWSEERRWEGWEGRNFTIRAV